MNEYQHRALAAGRWKSLSLSNQMANIGSEISRAIKWERKKNEEQKIKAVMRGLELIDLTIDDQREKLLENKSNKSGALKELTRLREVVCDYFFGDNEYKSSEINLMKYFDQFAMLDYNKV